MKKQRFSLLLCFMLCLCAAPLTAQPALRIGALIKNESNPFFLTMADGYRFAAARYGVDIVIGSTPTEDSADEQLALLETWLNEGGFDALIVTPFRATSLNSALRRASEQGIPILNVDELIPADGQAGINLAAQVASNNVRAGALAADLFLDFLAPGDPVAVIEGAPGTTSSIDRVRGFTEGALFGRLNVVASQPANWDRAQAYDVAANILQSYPDVRAIFAANDVMGLGAIEAIEDAGLSDQVLVASVDAIPEALAAVSAGRLAGTVAQYPDEMAILAVEAALKVIAGRPVAPQIEAPVEMITAQNVATAGSRLGDPQIGALRIGALIKNESNPFFLTMADGYRRAATDFGIEVVIGSTPTEDAAEQQLRILETWLTEGGFSGLAVTPFRASSLNAALSAASAAHMPLVNVDELIPADALMGIDLAAQIASNNVQAGALAADLILSRVEPESEVAVIDGAAGTTSSIDRVRGFTEGAMRGGLIIVASQPADWERTRAYDTVTNLLPNHPNLRAIFAANDVMGLGALEALEAAGRADEVLVVSVDAIPEALDAVRAGRLAGTVAQYPDEMAYLAVEALIKVIEGRPVAPYIEAPVVMLTAENLENRSP